MSFIRVSLRGGLPSGEVWSVNPAYNETTNVGTWDQTAGQKAADAIGALNVPTSLKNLLSTAAPMRTVRVERRSDDGALLGAAEAPWVGGGGSSETPKQSYQASVVLSLRSNVPGSRGRGRLYWPALGAGLSSSTLRLSTPTPVSVATDAVAYLNSIETALKQALAPTPSLIDYHLSVYSPTTKSKTDIVRLEVGDILDVQRRRRDRVAEVFASRAYPS